MNTTSERSIPDHGPTVMTGLPENDYEAAYNAVRDRMTAEVNEVLHDIDRPVSTANSNFRIVAGDHRQHGELEFTFMAEPADHDDPTPFQRRVEKAFRAHGWTSGPPLVTMSLSKGPLFVTGGYQGGFIYCVQTTDLPVDASMFEGDPSVPGLYVAPAPRTPSAAPRR